MYISYNNKKLQLSIWSGSPVCIACCAGIKMCITYKSVVPLGRYKAETDWRLLGVWQGFKIRRVVTTKKEWTLCLTVASGYCNKSQSCTFASLQIDANFAELWTKYIKTNGTPRFRSHAVEKRWWKWSWKVSYILLYTPENRMQNYIMIGWGVKA